MNDNDSEFNDALECAVDVLTRCHTWQEAYGEYRTWCHNMGEPFAFRVFMAAQEMIGGHSKTAECVPINNVIQFPVRR